jgi:5-methylcytosine-specific restriction endonuclease McrA
VPDRTCATPGCTKPHRARGLCSTHYNQANAKPVTMACAVCGTAVVKDQQYSRRVVCSYACRTWLQNAGACDVPASHPSRSSRVPDTDPSRTPITCDVPASHPSRAPRRIWVAGNCVDCATPFIRTGWDYRSRYCSPRCLKRTQKRVRRAHQHGATGTFTWDAFAKLTRRLGNRCAYCGTDNQGRPLEPDHVMPLSRGGHNGLANILPSCRDCNSRKSDSLPTDWEARCRSLGRAFRLTDYKHLTAHVFMRPAPDQARHPA